jgi:TPR repeat protein
MYSQGEGVKRDYSQSYMWLSAAVANGFSAPAGLKHRDSIAKKLSATQLSQAESQAASYVAQHKASK